MVFEDMILHQIRTFVVKDTAECLWMFRGRASMYDYVAWTH